MTSDTIRKRAAERANTGELAFLARHYFDDLARWRKIHLGYTIEEERMWLLFNRCCHPGRKIRLLPRPMRMAVGVPNSFAIRRTFSDAVTRDILKAAQ